MTYEENRIKLEKEGAEWFDTLRKLKALTNSITNNETLDILEYTDMRDNVRAFLSIMEYHLNEFKLRIEREKLTDAKARENRIKEYESIIKTAQKIIKKLEEENENETMKMKQCENCEIRTFCERVFYDLYNETGE